MDLGTILSKCCSNLVICKYLFGVKLYVIYISPCQYEMGNVNCVHANHLENITCSFIEVAHLHLVPKFKKSLRAVRALEHGKRVIVNNRD